MNVKHQPPLSLYVHIPWCVRKCPYCDFNSHPVSDQLNQQQEVAALLADLEQDLSSLDSWRPLTSIFIGGGTPSLFAPEAIDQLLAGIHSLLPWDTEPEITLEANPGTLERGRFAEYRALGINRLSLGIQSFDSKSLQRLGRIHNGADALAAIAQAKDTGFSQLNLDLMFGLPEQTPAQALVDLDLALKQAPTHLSFYQLTIEPNTAFAHQPPKLPSEDDCWEMQQQGARLLKQHGYRRYEVSAYAKPDAECRHNRNYWEFGDYLGIGAGAHGKLTQQDGVWRYWKVRHPEDYQLAAASQARIAGQRQLDAADLQCEFLLNAFRLKEGWSLALFQQRTGLSPTRLTDGLDQALQLGFIQQLGDQIRPTEFGFSFLNDLLLLFD